MMRSQDDDGEPGGARDGRRSAWRRWAADLERLGGSLLVLRGTWILWIASFLALYAFPTLFVEAAETAAFYVNAWDWAVPYPYRWGSWTWDVELWLPMVLAVVAPAALHRWLARRAGSPFVVSRATDAVTHDYRSPGRWVIRTSPRVVRRLVTLYAARLALALTICMLPLNVLFHTRFRENFGCVWYPYVRSPSELVGFATMLLAVALFHVPFTRRVLGQRPDAAIRGA